MTTEVTFDAILEEVKSLKAENAKLKAAAAAAAKEVPVAKPTVETNYTHSTTQMVLLAAAAAALTGAAVYYRDDIAEAGNTGLVWLKSKLPGGGNESL